MEVIDKASDDKKQSQRKIRIYSSEFWSNSKKYVLEINKDGNSRTSKPLDGL